jgi:outer membrane immunogenic protein
MRRYSFLAAAAVIGLTSSVASAADLYVPRKAPAYAAPPPSPILNWTGCYAGLNAGYQWSTSTVQTVGTPGPFDTVNNFGPDSGLAAQLTNSSLHPKQEGFIGGGQIGCNWQFAPTWVAGFEEDFQGLSSNHNPDFVTAGGNLQPNFPDRIVSTTTVSRQVDWLGTVRGRLGALAAPTLLVYGTGGLAYGEAKASTTISQTASCIFGTVGSPCPGAGGQTVSYGSTGSFSEPRAGWTLGGGLEWMFAPHWTFKAEYLYYDLGKETLNLPRLTGNVTGCAASPCWSANAQSTAHFNGNVVRAGINYFFF